MAEEAKGKRGRKPKTEADASVFIEDASIKPYKIRVGERSYDVIKGDDAQPECFHIKLESALMFIARQTVNKSKLYTIAEYLKELKENQTSIVKAVNAIAKTEVV